MILQKSVWSKYCFTVGFINVKESNHEELLGITIDKYLDFKKHIENLCWKANYKLHTLRRMRKYLAAEKAKLLGNTLIDKRLFILRLKRYIIRRLELFTIQMPFNIFQTLNILCGTLIWNQLPSSLKSSKSIIEF